MGYKRANKARALMTQPIQAARDQEIIRLMTEQKMSMNRVAREMGLSPSTVHDAYHRYLSNTRSISQEMLNGYRLEQLAIQDEVIHDLLQDFRAGSRKRETLEPLGKFLHQRAMLLGMYPQSDKQSQPSNIQIVFVQGEANAQEPANIIEGHSVRRAIAEDAAEG